jgi:hypothetical protein
LKKGKDIKNPSRDTAIVKIENSSYFAPVSFAVLALAMVILFRDFFFSKEIFHSGDLVQAGFFFRHFFVSYVKANHAIPMWDPYIFGGMPFVDAFHGDIFYPLSKLVFLNPLFRFLCFNLILHIYLSGIFTYLCARQLKLSRIPALMAAITYMFSAYLISLIAPFHDGKIFVTALFPLTILFIDRGFEKRSFLNFSLYGLVVGIIILTPHAQMAYATLWANAFYTIFKLVVLYRRNKSLGQVAQRGILTVYGVLIGLLISAIQFYPGYYYTKHYSPRSDTKKGWDWATSWSLHQEEAFSLLIPEFVGTNTTKAETYYWGKNPFKDNSETVGIVPLFLALLALFGVRKKESYFFGGLALFALIYALGGTTPIFRIFYYLMPMVKSLRAPSMIMFLFVFSVAILAGMGLQYIITIPYNEKKPFQHKAVKYVLIGMPSLMLLFALLFSVAGRGMLGLWTSIFYRSASTTMVQQNFSKFDVALMNLPAIQSGAWFAFLFVVAAALCIWFYIQRKAGLTLILILLLIPLINSLRFNQRFITVFDYKPYIQMNQVVNFLKTDQSKYRVQDFTQNSTLNLAYHGVELVTGYHGNQLKWYDQLIGGPAQRNVSNPRLLDLLGTKYIIIPPNQRVPDNYFGPIPVKKVQTFPGGQILQNDNAFPRVFLADSVIISPDIEQTFNSVLRGKEDLRHVVYLEEQPDLLPADTISKSDSAWIISHGVDSVSVGIACRDNKILVLTDNYYEAWKAFVDGKPARIMRADGSFRAVAIPAGTKRVMFRYESERYRTGKSVTLATFLYLIGVFGYFSVKGILPKIRRKSTPSDEQ